MLIPFAAVALVSTTTLAWLVREQLRQDGIVAAQRLAYDLPAESATDARDVFLMRVDGAARFSVAAHPAEENVFGWAPDGGSLLFVSDRSGSSDLWSVRIMNGQPAPMVTLLKSNLGPVAESSGLDRNGGLLYGVRTSAATIAVATLDLERGVVVSAPDTPFENYFANVRGPDWSKAGVLVAIAEQPRRLVSLTLRTPEGKRLRDVPLPMVYAQRPRWAPDGSITVHGVDLKGRSGIYRFDLDTAQLAPLVLGDRESGQVIAHSWLDHARLLYQRNIGGTRKLMLRTVASGEERVLVEHSRLLNHSPSPDSTKVAYAIEDQQSAATVVHSFDVATGATTEILRVARPAQFGNLLLWTPDGRSMLFARNDKGKATLWVVPGGGGEPKAINLELGLGYSSMRIHPDGRRIAYHTGHRAIELWRLDNFLPSPPASSMRR